MPLDETTSFFGMNNYFESLYILFISVHIQQTCVKATYIATCIFSKLQATLPFSFI